LDPLEGTTITAVGGNNALAVVAMAQHGNSLQAPDVYMRQNRRWGWSARRGGAIWTRPVAQNLAQLAAAKGTLVENLMVCVLDRRHAQLIADIRATCARINLDSRWGCQAGYRHRAARKRYRYCM
jgi:fructose-1,6-bisphosphatase/sedoheptulose 1,7-bisphosphatase-like protein